MRIFVMWSGDNSRKVGEAATKLLKAALTSAKVFISTQMPAGSLWKEELSKNLKEANIGIACFTPENMGSPWMHYESGMIAKMPDHRICTLRIGLTHIVGPLEERQSTDTLDKEAVFRLVLTLNNDRPLIRRKSESSLRTTFESQWREFSEVVKSALRAINSFEHGKRPTS